MSGTVFHSRTVVQWMLLDAEHVKRVTSIEAKEIMEWTYHRSVSMALD